MPFLLPHSLFLLLLGLFLIAPLPSLTRAQSTAVDLDQAIEIVTELQLGGTRDGIRLFTYQRLLPPGESVSDWKRPVFVSPARGWFLFVDRYPGANWEHPCWYFFVDAASGRVQRFDATAPPYWLGDLNEITSGRDNPPPGVSEASLERFSQRLRQLPKPATARGQAWAFIISGGANQGSNHIRYWNDSAFIYRALVEYYGYADDHIRVCISDGTNPAADRSDGSNSPPDLDGDGDDDIEYPATLAYVGQVFDELATTLTAADQLFIFTTDHGSQESGQDCYLNLWNLEELRDDQLAAYVDALPCETVICAFEQCYSGGMIDDLTGEGRVIATAADWDELSWAMAPDYIYDTFVYHWTSAVAFARPDGTPVDADTNDDGIVSMHEAFLFAEANDFDDETPQYSSTPAQLGEALNLFGNLEGVYLVSQGVFIDDDGAGPSAGDGDGVIDFGETIELSITLHNLGQDEALSVVGTLTSSSPHVTLIAPESSYGNILPEATVTNALPFVFSVADNVPDNEPLEIVLGLNENPGSVPVELIAAAPAYTARITVINDALGNGDGLADPGEHVMLTLQIDNTGGCDSPVLDAVLHGETFFQTDLIPWSVGEVPAGGSNSATGFAVQVSPDCPAIHSEILPIELIGPASYRAWSEVPIMVGPWFDTAEFDLGWSLGVPGDDATSGLWERSDPIGTVYNSEQVQPEDDHTPNPGQLCFVTGNGGVGGAAGDNDVDNGTTTLLSPVFNVSGAASATLSYWRWYTNDLGNNPGEDYWSVDVNIDDTAWEHLEHTMASENAWVQHTWDLGALFSLGQTVQFRFVASDLSVGSLVEAAVDDILVTIVRPPLSGVQQPEILGLTNLGPFRPNPVGAGASLSYRLARSTPLTIEVFDLAGRRIRTLFSGTGEAGEHKLDFRAADQSGRRIAAGIYFLRMRTPSTTQVRQFTVIR